MQYIGREEPQGSLSTAVNQSLQKVLQHKLQKLEQRSELQRALGPNSPITIDQQLYLNSIAAHPELVDQTRKQFLIDNYQREQTAKRAGAATPPLVSNVQGSSVVPAPTAQPQGRGLPIGGNTQPISTPIQTAMGSALQAPTTQVATNTPVPPRLAGHALEDPSRPGKLMPTPYLTAHDRNANAIQAENMKFKREQATQKAESRAQDIKWREEGRTVEQQKQQFAQQNALEKSYEAPKKILETLAEKNTIDDEQLESMDIVDRFNKPGALFEGPFQGPLKGAIDKADYGDTCDK